MIPRTKVVGQSGRDVIIINPPRGPKRSGLTIGHAEFEASYFPIKFTKLKYGFLTLKEALQQGVACGRADNRPRPTCPRGEGCYEGGKGK